MNPTEPDAGPPPSRVDLSRHPALAWTMLAIGVPVGGWLLWEIERTIGLSTPRLWELLRTDRVFDLAMLDFTLTAGWAYFALLGRSGPRDWRLWAATPLFFVAPSMGIALFVLLDRSRKGRGAGRINAR